ncbi:MAG TPA: rRNA maturation RNase YbeY [Longimicrobiales bacterium]|nr:rRNA maturation RNase YbeY [Longimicrobiales bacterium]
MPRSVRVQPGAALSLRPFARFTELRNLIARAARAALRHQRISDAELSVTLLDDDEITTLNRRFLAHDGTTDVISFALFEPGDRPVGDIYIGWEQANRQAAQLDVPVTEEIARVTIHGVLHVLGHVHPDGTDRLTSDMWQIQESILAGVRSA